MAGHVWPMYLKHGKEMENSGVDVVPTQNWEMRTWDILNKWDKKNPYPFLLAVKTSLAKPR